MLNKKDYQLNGFCVRKISDNTTSVHINLFNTKTPEEIIDTIIHEAWCHQVLFDIGEIESALKGDCELVQKTLRWLKN